MRSSMPSRADGWQSGQRGYTNKTGREYKSPSRTEGQAFLLLTCRASSNHSTAERMGELRRQQGLGWGSPWSNGLSKLIMERLKLRVQAASVRWLRYACLFSGPKLKRPKVS